MTFENLSIYCRGAMALLPLEVSLRIHDQAVWRCPVRAVAGAEAVEDLFLAICSDFVYHAAAARAAFLSRPIEITLRVANHRRFGIHAIMLRIGHPEPVQHAFLAAWAQFEYRTRIVGGLAPVAGCSCRDSLQE